MIKNKNRFLDLLLDRCDHQKLTKYGTRLKSIVGLVKSAVQLPISLSNYVNVATKSSTLNP